MCVHLVRVWGEYVVSSECFGCVGAWVRGDAVPMCGSWGRGCVMQLCLKSTSPTGELSERGASLFCPTDGCSSVCKASPCSWSCKCSSLSYRSRSGLTDSGKERGSLDCEQNSVLREASPASSPVLPTTPRDRK